VAVQLGAALREAREARELAFEEVAAATRIHPRFLAALEAERFATLPGRAYARSFLHEYAAYLGLDPVPFVAEYDARFCETRVAPDPLVLVRRPSHRRRRVLVSMLTLATLVVAVLAWRFGGTRPDQVAAAPAPAARAAAVEPVHKTIAPKPQQVLAIAARDGPCWLSVRARSATGALVYEGTLQPGRTIRFGRGPLWVRFGAPWNAAVRLNGRAVALPTTTQPTNLLFTSVAQQA